MDFEALVAELQRPEAYGPGAGPVSLRQTHISAVFLVGGDAYKLKKPVNLGFLDYSTRELRDAAAHAEVELNRRLAPDVYLGLVPVTLVDGHARLGGEGPVLELAVHMRRLPDDRCLRALLAAGEVTPALLRHLAERLARFYRDSPGSARIAALGDLPQVEANCRENFDQLAPFVGATLSPAVFEALRDRTGARLAGLGPLIAARARRGVPRDTHGDLRLEHVYWFPDRPAPADLVVIDCIEFNERFRFADPVADVAFLAMELEFYGAPELAAGFAREYFRASGDAEGAALLPFYAAYRHVVRGKVRSFQSASAALPVERRQVLADHARAHFLPALGHLAPPGERPCLVLLSGLPGTGKSTLARDLTRDHGFVRVSTDRVRKELAGLAPGAPGPASIYTPDFTVRTYRACREQVEALLLEGRRVVVDGSLRDDPARRPFVELARRWRLPVRIFVCRARPEVVRARLEARRGDDSDADWAVYLELAPSFAEPGPGLAALAADLDTDGGTRKALGVLRRALARAGLALPSRSPKPASVRNPAPGSLAPPIGLHEGRQSKPAGRKPGTMGTRHSRRGSVIAVMWVVVILAALGAAAFVMSTGLGRKDYHQSIRENAFEAAKAAAEEAALLVNNGKVNVAIDTVLGASDAIKVDSPMIDSSSLRYMGIAGDQKPEITVRSAIVSPADLPKKPPLAQLEEIRQEIETRGYDPAMYQRLKDFWERVDGTDGKGVEGDREGIQGNSLTSGFWNMTAQMDIGSWGPANRIKEEKDPNGVVISREVVSNNMLPELHAIYLMFYTENADKTETAGRTGPPSTGTLKPAWQAAMLAVGRESASRMESCGSNPNLAMSHLVGDLKEGKAIASGTEVSITSAFMQSKELGANKTYLLEINAKMPYGEDTGATKMKGTAEYTTYRLFQKSEWEMAVANMADSLTRTLTSHGITPAQVGEMFPPDATQEGRAVDVPGSNAKYDPKKLLSDLIFKELPSTVGARMYPYTIANSY